MPRRSGATGGGNRRKESAAAKPGCGNPRRRSIAGGDVADTPYLLGRELAIDAATERSSDPEANARFTREYRRGYELPRA